MVRRSSDTPSTYRMRSPSVNSLNRPGTIPVMSDSVLARSASVSSRASAQGATYSERPPTASANPHASFSVARTRREAPKPMQAMAVSSWSRPSRVKAI